MVIRNSFFFSILLLLSFYFLPECFISVVFCQNIDKDDLTIPGSVVRAVKEIAPPVLWTLKDIGLISGTIAMSKGSPPLLRAGMTISVFGAAKLYEVANYTLKSRRFEETVKQMENCGDHIKIPSVVEDTYNLINDLVMNNFLVKKIIYLVSQMSDLQLIAACCAMFICVSIVMFTFLILWG